MGPASPPPPERATSAGPRPRGGTTAPRGPWDPRGWGSALRRPALRRALALALYTLALSFLPLAGTLGYFSALALGPWLSVTGVLVGVDTARRVREAPAQADPALTLLGAGSRELSLLGLLPLAILTVGMLYNRNCDPWGGLAFYLVGPLPCLALGFTAGVGGATLAELRRRQIALGLAPMALSIAMGLAILYTQPVVYAFDAWVGWFSGPIYDEVVSVRRTYLRFRLYNGLLGLAAWLAFSALLDPQLRWRPRATSRWRLVGLALALAGAAWFGLQPTRFGFTTTRASVAEALPAVHHTEHFEIRYRPGSATAREIAWVAAEHEFAWHELERRLGQAPEEKITSYVFASPNQKRRVFGAGRVEVSLPWKREIYLRHLPFPHDILHHELAHSFGATIGDPLFGLSARLDWRGPRLNMGLIEGFAVAMAPRSQGGLDVHDQAAVLDRLDRRPRLRGIMGLGFFTSASGRAYTAAGSFVAWLLDTRGPEALARLYRSAGDFEAAYGQSLASLEREWVAFLRARPIDDDALARMDARFRQPGIFRRPCAHRSAVTLEAAASAARRGDANQALALLEGLCALEPEQPGHRIALGDTLARLERHAEAARIFDEAATMPSLPETYAAALAARRGDVALVIGDLVQARAAYERAAGLVSDDGMVRTLDIKRRAAGDPGAIPAVADYFRLFADHDEGDAGATLQLYAAIRLRERPGWSATGDYLVARQLLNAGRPDLARAPLERALTGVPERGEPPLEGEAMILAARLALVDARLRSGDPEAARDLVDRMLGEASLRSGDRLDLERWRARIDFYAAYFDGRWP